MTESEQVIALRDNALLLWLMIGVGSVLSALYGVLALAIGITGAELVLLLLLALGGIALCVGAAVLIQRDKVRYGRRILFYGLVVSSTLGIYLIGGATGPLVLGLLVPIVSAGLLGSNQDGPLVTVVAVILGLVLLFSEASGVYIPPITPNLWLSGGVFMSAALFLAALASFSGRDLMRVVSQSQERAEELLRKTEQLMEKSIQQVELGSDLSAAAAQLQITSQQQASGASEQASAVSQVSTTIEELGSTARQIAQASEHVANAGQQTLENLSTGQDAVDEAIQAMERIRGRVQDVSARVLSLGERSQQIGEIIDLIDDISDETHLLALNAAIEAAGAGEHGRRFAVVAAEVKSLANRTLAAAKEVKGVIAEIRQATSSAILAAEEGSKEVERGVELAHRAGQTMDNIVMVAERTAQSAAEINLATAQQQSASEQVVETMREIAEVARQSAHGARQLAEAAATLTAIADRLHGITLTEH
jgi:methyl-accepting chemotaxis protein